MTGAQLNTASHLGFKARCACYLKCYLKLLKKESYGEKNPNPLLLNLKVFFVYKQMSNACLFIP